MTLARMFLWKFLPKPLWLNTFTFKLESNIMWYCKKKNCHKLNFLYVFKNSHGSCSVKKGALKDFPNLKGKHLRWSLFLIKFKQLYLQETQRKWFPVKYVTFFRIPILKNVCQRLLLYFDNAYINEALSTTGTKK